MSRKRLRLTIVLLSLAFFCVATAANYYSAYVIMQSTFSNNTMMSYEIRNIIQNTYLSEEELSRTKIKDEFLPEYIAFCAQRSTLETFPYMLAVTDDDNNILAKSHSSLYVVPHYDGASEENAFIINLDNYLTDEIKKELKKYALDPDYLYYFPDVKYFSFRKEAGEYIPVKLCFKNTNGSEEKLVIFSDRESNITFTSETDKIRLNIYGFETKSYEKNCYKSLQKVIDGKTNGLVSDIFTTTAFFELNGKPYYLIFAAAYNPIMRTLTSKRFIYMTLLTALLFIIIGALVLIISQALLKKSQQLEKSKRTFISAAAHELKTPLAVIQNQCECILEDAVPEKKDEYIKSVYDEALRMNDIVSSLLTFNRLSSTDTVPKEKINLSELIKTEVNKYLSFARANGAEITVKADEEIYINCNAELMALAVDNYLSNAVKYTADEKEITVSLTKNRNSFMLEVYNTAEPIDENRIKDIWNILERKDSSRTRKGTSTGMGLAICKRIFEIHGFKGECKNADKGVIFSITGKA